MDRLAHNTKITRCHDAIAAGTTDQNGTGLDMSGYNGVTFIASFGAIVAGAATGIKAQQSDDDGSSDAYSDIVGTAIAIDDDEDTGMLVLDIIRPTKQWVRLVVTRGTQNATIDGAIALQYGAATQPVTHDATTVMDTEVHDDPAEGTA